MTFPKEYRKSLFADADPRYLAILFGSFVLHISLVLVLSKLAPPESSQAALAKIQQRFVEGLLKREEAVSLELEEKEQELEPERFGPELRGTIEALGEMGAGTGTAIPEPEPPRAATAETAVPPAETLGARREEAAASRERGRAALSESVRDIGLLGVITAGSGVVDYAEIADILQFADSTAVDIEQAMAFLDGLKVPRGSLDYGSAIGDGVGTGLTPEARQRLLGYVPLKGERYESDRTDTDRLIGRPRLAKSIPVSRSDTFVDVPSETGMGLHASDGALLRSTRDPQQAGNVVTGHNAAIQDCYKYFLRRNPNLRGKIVVRFTVTPAGRVSRVLLVSSTFDLPQLEECIMGRIRRWNDFEPIDPNAGDMTFRQTYIFTE